MVFDDPNTCKKKCVSLWCISTNMIKVFWLMVYINGRDQSVLIEGVSQHL